MKKISAWTMVEVIIALSLILLLSGMCLTVYKPNVQKARIFVYAALKNLTRGNLAILQKDEDIDELPMGRAKNIANNTNTDKDAYCIALADVFALKSLPDCKVDSEVYANTKVNITFPNESTVQGLTNNWITPYPESEFKFKNIVLDIDGSKGVNKVWVDRFPLRIYNGGAFTGNIQAVDCSDDAVYKEDGTKIALDTNAKGKNPYCKQGFTSNGAEVKKAFPRDKKVISYDVFRAATDEEETTGVLIASALSPMEADCGAYGGAGFFHKKQCGDTTKGVYRILSKCATTENCDTCATTGAGAICPKKADDSGVTNNATECKAVATSLNPSDLTCFIVLHKPSGGTTFLLETLVGEFDDD